MQLVPPWKYGFKRAKSLVQIELIPHSPATFWNSMAPHDSDFRVTVNPDVLHPRWSQAMERDIGTSDHYPTLPFNGYGEWVAHLYKP